MKIKRKTVVTAVSVTPPEPIEFRLLVVGSRDWMDIDALNKAVTRAIVDSGARQQNVLVMAPEGEVGVPWLIRNLCLNELGVCFCTFPAPVDFARSMLGDARRATPLRNEWMIRWGRPDLVLALHPYIPKSRETKDVVETARLFKVPVRIVEH